MCRKMVGMGEGERNDHPYWKCKCENLELFHYFKPSLGGFFFNGCFSIKHVAFEEKNVTSASLNSCKVNVKRRDGDI